MLQGVESIGDATYVETVIQTRPLPNPTESPAGIDAASNRDARSGGSYRRGASRTDRRLCGLCGTVATPPKAEVV